MTYSIVSPFSGCRARSGCYPNPYVAAPYIISSWRNSLATCAWSTCDCERTTRPRRTYGNNIAIPMFCPSISPGSLKKKLLSYVNRHCWNGAPPRMRSIGTGGLALFATGRQDSPSDRKATKRKSCNAKTHGTVPERNLLVTMTIYPGHTS